MKLKAVITTDDRIGFINKLSELRWYGFPINHLQKKSSGQFKLALIKAFSGKTEICGDLNFTETEERIMERS